MHISTPLIKDTAPVCDNVLTYWYEQSLESKARGILILVHGFSGQHNQLLPLARSVAPGLHIYAPEAARPAIFMRDTAPEEMIDAGKTWYLSSGDYQIEPATFGDSLAQLEIFIRDIIIQQDMLGLSLSPIILMGCGQGGVLVLSLATVIPELLAGVIAINGHLPAIRALADLRAEADGLAVLMIECPAPEDSCGLHAWTTSEQLTAAGASVTHTIISRTNECDQDLRAQITTWLTAQPFLEHNDHA